LDKYEIAKVMVQLLGPENVKIDEPMKKHTSFKVGGPADLFLTPGTYEEIAGIMNICHKNTIPYLFIGNGSNLLVRDKGIQGVVIQLQERFNKCVVRGNIIEAEAGALLSVIAQTALKHGLSGFEFASGIPGTLGGAIVMNAGAYGGEMKDVVIKTEYMDSNGKIKAVEGENHKFGYRSSFAQNADVVVLKSYIRLHEGDKDEIKKLMDDLKCKRKEKQPLEYPSAGSVFKSKREEGYYSWQLVDGCCLRGYRIGGAEISNKHCNFIINVDNAKASDIISLIKLVQTKVKEKFNLDMETEIKIVGEE